MARGRGARRGAQEGRHLPRRVAEGRAASTDRRSRSASAGRGGGGAGAGAGPRGRGAPRGGGVSAPPAELAPAAGRAERGGAGEPRPGGVPPEPPPRAEQQPNKRKSTLLNPSPPS